MEKTCCREIPYGVQDQRKEKTLLSLVKEKVGEVTADEIISVVHYAANKLAWIIAREGTNSDKRTSLEYFASLVAEQIIANRFTRETKKEVCRKSEHTSNNYNHSIIIILKNQ